MDFKTNYPYVFVHGMFGFGPDSKTYESAPYFGLFGGSVTKYFCDNGIEAYDAAVGPFSSAWDRACELYAQMTGTTVDYGKAHSERFGHERYGRTYKQPMIPGWGQVGPDGNIKKVNLMGHGFGGTTARLLIALLAYGCEAEKEATDPSEISPLFTGGKADWVHSQTTYATPHNGMTLFAALGERGTSLKKLVYKAGNKLNGGMVPMFYDFKLDQFGLTSDPKDVLGAVDKDAERAEAVAESEDNAFFDLSLEGAEKLNSHLRCVPNVYYFSYTGSRTKKGAIGKKHTPNRDMFLPLKYTARIIGSYANDVETKLDLDAEWLENDGVVNTYSCTAPFDEPATDFSMVKEVTPGIWYKMGNMNMDHSTFCGLGISSSELCEFYYKHAVGINNL